MEFITAYLAGVVALTGLWALRVPHENVRTVFVLAVMWPVTLILVLGAVVFAVTGWDYDVIKGLKMFGFRRAGNPEVRGYALTLFRVEFQMWKTRKA